LLTPGKPAEQTPIPEKSPFSRKPRIHDLFFLSRESPFRNASPVLLNGYQSGPGFFLD
jgi:hypothetical protein